MSHVRTGVLVMVFQHSGYASFERSTPPEVALDILRSDLRRLGLSLSLSKSEGKGSVSVAHSVISADGVEVETGLGKGIGAQVEASAGYEALEHAVWKGAVTARDFSIKSDEVSSEVLAQDPLVRYALASGVEDFAIFREVNSRGGRGCKYIYPRGVTAPSLPVKNGAGLVLSSYCSSSGCASGVGFHDAFVHALNEVIERDALGCAMLCRWMGSLSATTFASVSDRALEKYRNQITETLGEDVYHAELECLAGYTVCAYTSGRDGRPRAGYGCSGDIRYAAERALSELLQDWFFVASDDGLELDGHIRHDLLLTRFPELKWIADMPHVFIDVPCEAEVLDCDRRVYQSHDLVARINRCGKRVLANELFNGPGGSSVVQVVIPGAERFHLVASGRPVFPTGRMRNKALLDGLARGA